MGVRDSAGTGVRSPDPLPVITLHSSAATSRSAVARNVGLGMSSADMSGGLLMFSRRAENVGAQFVLGDGAAASCRNSSALIGGRLPANAPHANAVGLDAERVSKSLLAAKVENCDFDSVHGPIITQRVFDVNAPSTPRAGENHGAGQTYWMDFGKRLSTVRKRRDMTQEQLALACGWPGQSRIGNYERSGRTPALADIEVLSRALNVPPAVLADQDTFDGWAAGKPLRPIAGWDNPGDHADTTDGLPTLEYYLSAGPGGPDPNMVEQTDKVTLFRSDYISRKGWNPRTHYTFRCLGDSMEPSIQNGAPVVIDTSATAIRSGRVYAVLLDGEPLLKRLDRLPGGMIRVRSDSQMPQYAPFEVPESALRVIGQAVWTSVDL